MKVTGGDLNRCATVASCIATRLYNIIRDVGHGNLTADNALHQLIEDMNNARELSESLLEMSNSIPWDGKDANK